MVMSPHALGLIEKSAGLERLEEVADGLSLNADGRAQNEVAHLPVMRMYL